jgi:cytochrome c-type biogenesis protein
VNTSFANPGHARRRRGWLIPAILVVLATAIGGSWLLIVYLLDGRNVLQDIQLNLQVGRAGQMQSVNSVLVRSVSLSEHVELLAVYATPEFFEVANRQTKGIPYDPETEAIFIINEDTHMGALAIDPTPVTLRVNGVRDLTPTSLRLLNYSDHHKVSIATFPRRDAEGRPLFNPDGAVLELIASTPEPAADAAEHSEHEGSAVMRWQLPIAYPDGALDGESVPFGTMIAVSMGLLATVMTPCLIQLLIVYMSTLTGMSAEQLEGTNVPRAARNRLLQVAFGFVLGYTLLFTSAGALAGFAGETLQNSWGNLARPLAIGSGVVMVALALWMAVRARAPLVCRLPMFRNRLQPERTGLSGLVHSTLIGLTFAIGCSTCFGGALIATLLLYVGTLGSAWQGALILFFFSLGVGIPFMVAAALLTRVMPAMQRFHRVAPTIGLVSSVMVMVFGVLLITDQFHVVSGWITPLIGLS